MKHKQKTEFVTVYLAQGILDAESVRGFLEAQGIPAVLDSNPLGQIYGLTIGDLGQVGIRVRAGDVEQAKTLLQAMEAGEFEDEVLLGAPLTLLSDFVNEGETDYRRRVLFLCTGNSARSQFAEAVVNHYLPLEWSAFSAGSEPTGFVHEMATVVLHEDGIPHQGYSKSVDEFEGQEFDLVVTLCDSARETCPLWLQKGAIAHFGFDDPAEALGTEEQKLQVFRKIFNDIKTAVISYLNDFE